MARKPGKAAKTTTKGPRKIRSYEERLAEYDRKIKYHKDAIAAIEAKKQKMQNPPMSKEEKKALITAVAQSGKSVNEIIEKLKEV